MSANLPDLLIQDHRHTLEAGHQLLAVCRREPVQEGECFAAFRRFKALVNSLLKAEEYVLYAKYEGDPSAEVRDFVFEAYEEHDLIDLLLKEMGQAEEISPQWLARLKVACSLLERHLEDEEKRFLPHVRSQLEADSGGLAERYGFERDQIYKKKSGSKPALTHYPVSLTSH